MKLAKFVPMLLIATLLLIGNITVAGAQGPPGQPSSFYGTVTVDGANVPDDTDVTAWINGTQQATARRLTDGGNSVYVIAVTNGNDGDTIEFRVGDLVADQTGTWQLGGNVALNLTATSVQPTATPPPPQPTATPQPPQPTATPTGPTVTVTPAASPTTTTGTGECDVGVDNACVLVLGDVFVNLANIIFPNFVLTGESGYVRVEDVPGNVRDVDNTDLEWSPFLSAIGDFADQNDNAIPVGGADELIVECLAVDDTTGPATATCERINFVRRSSSGNITTILSGDGIGSGEYPFTLAFELLIPADTVPGNYATTINIDKVYGSDGP